LGVLPTELWGSGYPLQVLSRSVGFENPTPRLPGFSLLSLTQKKVTNTQRHSISQTKKIYFFSSK
jgi:hypothetical protein